jgi:hypothetical protein
MATEAQVFANRSNARKSTGPRTAEGKAAVAENAVKHGLSGRLDVIKGEDQAEFDRQREAMLGEMAPVGVMELMLAERVVGLSWRLKRVERTQNQVFDALLADRSSPLAKLVQSLEPKAAGRPEDGPDGEGDLDLGRAVIKDFSNSRVLDRLLMYERRIEHSLYKTMAELQRLRLLRELDAPAQEPVCSGPVRASKKHVAGFQPAEGAARMAATQTPDGVTTNAPTAEDRFCKTKPISSGVNQGQLPDDKGVMENSPQGGLGETKPISACHDRCGAAGPQKAGTHLQPATHSTTIS